jgi:hypothetical protein
MASTEELTKEPSNEQYSQLEVAPPDFRDETQPKFTDLRESNQKFIVADSGRQEYNDPFESANPHRRFWRRKRVWLGVIAVVVIAAVVGGAVGGTEAKNNGKPRWDSF